MQQVNLSQIQGLPYTTASYSAAQRTQGAFQQINSQLQGTASGTPASAGFIAGAASLQRAVSTEVMQRSLESLSGQLHAASAAMTFEAIDAGTRALSDRFDSLLDTPQAGGWTRNLGYHGDMSRSGYGSVGRPSGSVTADNGFRCTPLRNGPGATLVLSTCTANLAGGGYDVTTTYSGDANYASASTEDSIYPGG